MLLVTGSLEMKYSQKLVKKLGETYVTCVAKPVAKLWNELNG